MSLETINNGDTGLSVRTKLNNNFSDIYPTSLTTSDINAVAISQGHTGIPGVNLTRVGVLNGKLYYEASAPNDFWSLYWEIMTNGGGRWVLSWSYFGDGNDSGIAYSSGLTTAEFQSPYPWKANGTSFNWGGGSITRSGGTSPYDVNFAPKRLGIEGLAGTSNKAAREDHIHPYPTPYEIGAAHQGHTHNSLDPYSSISMPSNVSNGSPFIYFNNGILTIGGIIKASNSSVAYNTTSDYRLKTNITPLTGAVLRISQIPVHTFNWIAQSDSPKVDGFLAHEVQDFVPEAITGTKDGVKTELKIVGKNPDGTPIEELTEVPVYQGIDQSKLVPLLTAAVKELAQKLDVALARIETLENK